MSGGGRRKQAKHSGNHERWLLTYSDMITLLMVFFIVLYAMSELDKQKYAQMAASLRHAFVGGGNAIVNTGIGTGDGMSIPRSPEEIKPSGTGTGTGSGSGTATVDPLEGIGQGLYADFSHDGRFTVRIAERGLIISLAGSALFDSGRADIKTEFVSVMDAIAERVKGIPNDISIEGNTDSDPIRTAEFPSNWELSTTRANRVRDYLETKGVNSERMIVVGYADKRPLAVNTTPEGKAKNRRVDVVILRDKPVIDYGQEIKTEKP
jgi:chemotaxis protein MotB